jgi:hypothetical protein
VAADDAGVARIVQAIVTLPDRGGTATPSDVPPEYFRYPQF